MKNVFRLLVILYLILGCTNNAKEKNVLLSNLRCELLTNPVGIDKRQPLLSWEITSRQRQTLQTAYQIIVASSMENLDNNIGDIWNSGKVESENSIHVKYEGKKLISNSQYFWKVKIWTNNGVSSWSEPAKWSIGYLNFKDWKGRWIGIDRSFPWDNEDKFSRLSARYLRKEINTSEKEIEKATVYILGLGLYELYLNGNKIRNQVLAPAPTDYTKNIKYNTFDVSKYVVSGENAIGVILGNGYFYTMRQNYKPYKIKSFGYPKLLLNLVIEYIDGSKQVFSTNNTWKITTDGPIRVNNLYDGEEYDAGKEMPGWNNIGYNDSKWLQAEYVQEPTGEIEAQINENMKIMETLSPVSIKKSESGKYILDMGQNIAGWLQIKVKGTKGQKITMRYAESLKNNGELFTANLRDAKVTDVYTLKGKGIEVWEPSFVYHGFRYAEIEGYTGTPELNNFKGCVVYDNIKTIGSFETSDTLINQIYKNAFWSINSTYKGIPIDCPQRNERMPWLGDRAVGCYNESFVMDNSRLYTKWLDDIMYSQKADGCISDVAPPYFRYYSDNMTWPGTCILVAKMLYHQYGLKEPIQKHYTNIRKWLLYMKDRYMKDFILTKDSYGDWCAPPKTIEEGRGKSADVKHPSELISSAYFYHYLKIMEEFAEISDNKKDKKEYEKLADSVKYAFNRKFFNADSGYYNKTNLTYNILPLYFNIVPKEKRIEVIQTISDIIEIQNNGHLSTGLVGAQWLMRTLETNDMHEIAFKLATNTTYPSWGYMVENGATTIWELWNANTAAPVMNSQNHVMLLGDLLIWYYENLAGIKSSEKHPGFKEIIMDPDFNNKLTYVKASYQSVYGLIKSNWKKDDDKITWDITIPANTTAVVNFPTNQKKYIAENGSKISWTSSLKFLGLENNKTLYRIGSGEYKFEIILN